MRHAKHLRNPDFAAGSIVGGVLVLDLIVRASEDSSLLAMIPPEWAAGLISVAALSRWWLAARNGGAAQAPAPSPTTAESSDVWPESPTDKIEID